jgi:hypothetical protein
MSDPEIFVSYAWKGESEALVNQLCDAFAAKGYTIRRDKSSMTYRASIKSFMDSIGRGKFIIAVVSDKYMKSEYCMYEAYRMFQSQAFGERVFPIVLPDADVFSFRGQAAYLKYWDSEYKSLMEEYKNIANVSPTMVAPLTERLRDIEATTLFINDFMSAVGDMNVLTSQTHLDSNFSQLISAIEAKMKNIEGDDSGEKLATSVGAESSNFGNGNGQKQEAIMTDERKIDTGGGTFIGGGVNTGGGEFVGRDKVVNNNSGTNISIGGSVSGGNIVVGNNNTVNNNTNTQNIFGPIYHAIEQSSRSTQDKEDLKAEYQEIETAVAKGQSVDESWLARRLRNLKRMAPDIAEVALAALAGPGAAVGVIVKQVAEKIKAEASV